MTDRAKAKALLELILEEFRQPWTEFDANAHFQFQGLQNTLEYKIHELFREGKT